MKIALVTDAWQPQVDGVVTTLVELVKELEALGHTVRVVHPGGFKTRPCPGYAGIDLAVRPARGLALQLDAFKPDAIHIATEGPLGWAARSYCLRHKLAFTTAFHTKFPEILRAALKVPLSWGYAVFRHFHKKSSGVMVPTQGVLRMLERRGFSNLRAWTHGVDTELFRFAEAARINARLGAVERPVSLFVGRVSYEQDIDGFLRMQIGGNKVVCGVGRVGEPLKAQFPHVRWLGVLQRDALASVYASADVFVFPSRSETFGLVMLEAMACGTPVAAYPVDGPLEVLGTEPPAGPRGGALHEDLEEAWRLALGVPRHDARARAHAFSWSHSAQLFVSHLIDLREQKGDGKRTIDHQNVTLLSSNQ